MSKVPKAATKGKRGTRGLGRLFKKAGAKQYPADSNVKGNYYLTYTVNGKRITAALRGSDNKPITDRDAAEAERKRIMAPYQTGDAVETLRAVRSRITAAEADHAQAQDEADPPLTIADAWRAFERAPERPDSGDVTLAGYQSHWQRFARWIKTAHPEAVYIRDVTSATAAEYAGDLVKAGLSSNRFNKHAGFLKMAFRVLGEAARITANPFDKIKRKTLRTHSRRELTIPELVKVLDTPSGDLGTLLLIGATTGLRMGDCCCLQWGEVDLLRGIIRRIPNKTARNGKPVVVGIPPALHHRLSETPEKRRSGYVLPDVARRYLSNPVPLANLVRDHIWQCGIDCHAAGTGSQIERDEHGEPVKDKHGKVKTTATGKRAVVDVGFHSLRHTWVSMHAAAGTPGAVIQNSVGHANPAMTAHYTHVNEITARDVAKALPVFADAGEPTREPLPAWAAELVEKMDGKTWKTIKAELLKGGAK